MSEKIRYQGKDLPVFTSDTVQHWTNGRTFVNRDGIELVIYWYIPNRQEPFLAAQNAWMNLAELPAPEKKRWTNREGCRASGTYGEFRQTRTCLDDDNEKPRIDNWFEYDDGFENEPIRYGVKWRGWNETEWREPEGSLPWEVEG